MAEMYVLNERDVRILQDAVRLVNNRSRNEIMRPPVVSDTPYLDTNSRPGTYVARTPSGGIPAIKYIATGTAPPTDVNGAECRVFQVDFINGTLRPIQELKPNVYNLSTQKIPGNAWIVVVQDNYGDWIACLVAASEPTTDAGAGECQLTKVGSYDCIQVNTYTMFGGKVEYYLEYEGAGHWTSPLEYSYTGGSGSFDFYFEDGRFRLKLDSLELVSCGDGCFSGGWITGHGPAITPAGSATSCDEPAFTVCIECSCCAIDNYIGPGWYCVEDTGPDDCIPMELLDEDKCDDEIVICSGPYASEAAALLFCPTGATPLPFRSCDDAKVNPITGATTYSTTEGSEGTCFFFPETDGNPIKVTIISITGSIFLTNLTPFLSTDCPDLLVGSSIVGTPQCRNYTANSLGGLMLSIAAFNPMTAYSVTFKVESGVC